MHAQGGGQPTDLGTLTKPDNGSTVQVQVEKVNNSWLGSAKKARGFLFRVKVEMQSNIKLWTISDSNFCDGKGGFHFFYKLYGKGASVYNTVFHEWRTMVQVSGSSPQMRLVRKNQTGWGDVLEG